MQKKWNTFNRKIVTKADNYSTVLKKIKVFLTKLFTATVGGKKDYNKKWSATNDEQM